MPTKMRELSEAQVEQFLCKGYVVVEQCFPRDLADEWIATQDKAGQPGAEMMNAYLSKLEAAGYTGLRDWSVQ